MDYVGIVLEKVYEIIKKHVPKHEKSAWFNHEAHEVRYDDRRLIYNVGSEVVVIRINVGLHSRSRTKAGPILFNMSDPDLFENIDKFLKDNAHS